jgi:hypothetical protein
MKNKILLVSFYSLLAGCASWKYPNWEQVHVVKSVYKQPCEFKQEEVCSDADSFSAECTVWYKKRATTYKANTFVNEVTKSEKLAAKYYYCGPGIPLYNQKPLLAWTIRHKSDPVLTYSDYEKAVYECNYQADVATYDASRPNPSRVIIPTLNYDYQRAQINAIEMDRMSEGWRQDEKYFMRSKIYNHCIDATGFLNTSTSNKKDFDDIEKYCPNIDNYVQACFIPGAQK